MKYTKILCLVFMIALISVFPVSATEGKNLPSEEQIKTLCESVTDKDNYASNLFESAKEKGYVCDLWACESCKGEKLAISFYYSANNAKGYKSIYTSQPGEYKSYIPNIELKDSYTGEERTYSKNGPESSCADCKTDSDKNDTETKTAYITVTSTGGGGTPITYPTGSKLTWKGIEWKVRSYDGEPGGENNKWLTNGAYIDDLGRLHLTITKEGDTFYSSELCTPTKYRYGVFRWRIETPLNDLDPNVCLAGFTYLNDTTEIDIEYSKWQYDTRELWYSNQPTTFPGYQIEQAQPIIGEIDWSPSRIIFSSWYADGTLISQYTTTTDIPTEESYFLLQCWLIDPSAGTASGGNLDFVFSDFSYNPSSSPVFTPVANFTANTTSGTTPVTVQFTDTSTNSPTSWLWKFGDGTTSTSRNPTHTYSTAGTYTVTLKATNEAGGDTETKINYITAAESQIPSVPILENIVPNTNFEKRQGIDMGFDDLEKRIEFENERIERAVNVWSEYPVEQVRP